MVVNERYGLIVYNDYSLVKIGDKVFLLDTGAVSMSWGLLDNVVINEKKFSLKKSLFNLPSSEMIASFGQEIAGIIGMDVMRVFGSVEVDLVAKYVSFGTITKEKNNVVPINDYMCTYVDINGQKARAFLDTGAHKVVVANHDLVDKSTYVRDVYEQSFTGTHKLQAYLTKVKIGSHSKQVEVLLHNDRMPKATGIDLYFGLNQFAQEYYVIDVKNGEFYYK